MLHVHRDYFSLLTNIYSGFFFCIAFSSTSNRDLSIDDGCGDDNVKKQEYDWLKKEKYSRAARISVHFFAVLHT